MKRRSMLMERIYETGKSNPRQSIGIIGTHHGVGVTFTALMLAFYMGEESGKRTALIECNNHHDMSRIQNAYEWSREAENSFSFHQITCYKEVRQNYLPDLLGMPYDTFILDFGANYETSRNELLRCNTKIMIGGRTLWEQQKLVEFVETNIGIGNNGGWIYLVPCANSRTIRYLEGELEHHIYSVPFEKDPTRLSKNAIKLFEKLF